MSVTLGTAIALILLLWGVLFVGAKLWQWSLVLIVFFASLQLLQILTGNTAFVVWAVLLGLLGILHCLPLRRLLISQRICRVIRPAVPKISTTEQEAIDAGSVWIEGDLFKGRPNWSALKKLPYPKLSIEEQSFIDNQLEHALSLIDDWQINHDLKDLPKALWDYLKKEKFFGMIIPKEHGGLGFSARAQSEVIAKIATKSITAAVTVMVPNSLGPGELLLHYGTQEQKDYYLPRLATGEELPCFGLTGVDAGSDAGRITDTGIVEKGQFEGQEVLGIRLNWNKRYITLAPVATVVGLAFKLFDPDHLLGEQTDIGITMCLLPTNHPGVVIGNRHIPMTSPFMNGPTQGKDVFIPLDWVIGGREQVGRGWWMLMTCLSVGRGISLPALAAASAKMGTVATSAYATIREQFSLPIGKFEGVQEALGRMGGLSFLLEAMRLVTVAGIDQGQKPSVVTAMAKYHMTELSRQVINDAMDIHGGRAIIKGPRNYLASAYENLPISITVEGANILTRSLMIFGQGAMRCHPYLYDEIKAITNADQKQGLKDFDRLIFKHAGYILSLMVRAKTMWLTKGRFDFDFSVHPINYYYRQVNRMSAAFAAVAEIATLFLHDRLKRKEHLSGRLGDVLSHLYMASCVIQYYRWQREDAQCWPMAKWALDYCFYQIQEAFLQFFENFPHRPLRWVMRVITFPLGRIYAKPFDHDLQQVVKLLMHPNAARDLYKHGVFVGEKTDPVGLVEAAFSLYHQVKPSLDIIKRAVKEGVLDKNSCFEDQLKQAVAGQLLPQTEADKCLVYERLRIDAIMVDDFENVYKEAL